MDGSLLSVVLVMCLIGISGCIGIEYSVGDSSFQVPLGWVENDSKSFTPDVNTNFLEFSGDDNLSLEIRQYDSQQQYEEDYATNVAPAESEDDILTNNTTIEGFTVRNVYYFGNDDYMHHDNYFFEKNGKYYAVFFKDYIEDATTTKIKETIIMIVKTIN
jgi:hypothetical protein